MLGGTRSLFCVNSKGAREIYPGLDQRNEVRCKNSKGFSGRNRKFKWFFRPKTGDLQKKKGLHPKNRCKSTKNTNLGLDLRSKSPKPINFFGAHSSLGGAQFSFGGHTPRSGGTIFVWGAQAVSWGGTAPVCPTVPPGLVQTLSF